MTGNNVDDNGIVDDAAGWNFLGSKDGANVQYDTDELTRLYSACEGLPAGSDYPKPDAAQCASVATAYRKQKAEVEGALQRTDRISNRLEGAAVVLRAGINIQTLTADRVREFTPLALDAQEARRVWLQMFDRGLTEEAIAGMRTPYQIRFKYGLDSLYNPRTIVGDANGPRRRGYGNRDVVGPDALHGTHVSGIIGAHWDDALLFGVPQHIGRSGSVPAVQRVGRARGPVD